MGDLQYSGVNRHVACLGLQVSVGSYILLPQKGDLIWYLGATEKLAYLLLLIFCKCFNHDAWIEYTGEKYTGGPN